MKRWIKTLRQLLIALIGLFLAPQLWSQCPDIHGQQKQGGLIWMSVAPGSQVTLDGEVLDVLDDGTTFAGFGRDAASTAELVIWGDAACSETLQIARQDYRIQRVEGVPQETVDPPPEVLERIRKESAMVRAARAKRSTRPDWLHSVLEEFAWPVVGPISGVYGSQRFYNGKPGNPHYGVDVAMPTGTAVKAAANGVVVLAEPDLFYSGGTVIIDHGYQLSSTYIHMSKVTVEEGQAVHRGDTVGEIGATGRATGPHLDWRLNWRKQRLDPQLLAPAMPKQ